MVSFLCINIFAQIWHAKTMRIILSQIWCSMFSLPLYEYVVCTCHTVGRRHPVPVWKDSCEWQSWRPTRSTRNNNFFMWKSYVLRPHFLVSGRQFGIRIFKDGLNIIEHFCSRYLRIVYLCISHVRCLTASKGTLTSGNDGMRNQSNAEGCE